MLEDQDWLYIGRQKTTQKNLLRKKKNSLNYYENLQTKIGKMD